MLRIGRAALAICALLIAACSESDAASPAAPVPTATATPARTPTPSLEADVALFVRGPGRALELTLAELRALPTTKLALPGGQTVDGILLETIAKVVTAAEAESVTIEGVRPAFVTQGFISGGYADVASSTVLTFGDEGIELFSTHFPEEEWLVAVLSVAFE